MNNIFDAVLILLMISYALLNGTAAYFLKISLSKVTEIEMTLKGFFQNPIRGFYHLLRIPTWVIGGILFVSGFLIYQYSLSLYDLSVVKPLSNLSLIVCFFWGFQILKEHIIKREIIGITAMVAGVILTSLFASGKESDFNQNNMIIFSIIFIFVALLFISVTFIKRNSKIDEFFLTLVSGILFSLGALFNNAIYVYGRNVFGDEISLEFFLFNPFLYFLVISYFFAFFIGQVAYARGRMVIVGPILSLLTVGLPVLGAVFIFNESLIILFEGALLFPLSFLKIIGIILILSGILVIYPQIKEIQEPETIQ